MKFLKIITVLTIVLLSFFVMNKAPAAAAAATSDDESIKPSFRPALRSDARALDYMAERSHRVTDHRYLEMKEGYFSYVLRGPLPDEDTDPFTPQYHVMFDEETLRPLGFIIIDKPIALSEIYPGMQNPETTCLVREKTPYLSGVTVLVDPDFRGKGLGKKLQQFALDTSCKRLGQTTKSGGIYVGPWFKVFVENRRQIHILYKKIGLQLYCTTCDSLPSDYTSPDASPLDKVHVNVVFTALDLGDSTIAYIVPAIKEGRPGQTIYDELIGLLNDNSEDSTKEIKEITLFLKTAVTSVTAVDK